MQQLAPLPVEKIHRAAYRLEEAAASIGVSTRTLTRWRKIGKGPPSALIDGVRLFPARELDRWIESRAREDGDAA